MLAFEYCLFILTVQPIPSSFLFSFSSHSQYITTSLLLISCPEQHQTNNLATSHPYIFSQYLSYQVHLLFSSVKKGSNWTVCLSDLLHLVETSLLTIYKTQPDLLLSHSIRLNSPAQWLFNLKLRMYGPPILVVLLMGIMITALRTNLRSQCSLTLALITVITTRPTSSTPNLCVLCSLRSIYHLLGLWTALFLLCPWSLLIPRQVILDLHLGHPPQATRPPLATILPRVIRQHLATLPSLATFPPQATLPSQAFLLPPRTVRPLPTLLHPLSILTTSLTPNMKHRRKTQLPKMATRRKKIHKTSLSLTLPPLLPLRQSPSFASSGGRTAVKTRLRTPTKIPARWSRTFLGGIKFAQHSSQMNAGFGGAASIISGAAITSTIGR